VRGRGDVLANNNGCDDDIYTRVVLHRRVTRAGQPENVDRLHDHVGGHRARLHIGHVGVHMEPREENPKD